MPELKSFKASSDGVVACSRGVFSFCTVLSDSPSLFRISEAVFPRCFEHMVLVARLCLRARERFPACAVDRLEGQKVLGANLRNRTVENGGAPGSLAEFPRDRRCEFRFGWLAHQAEGLLDLLIRDNAQEG